MRPSQICAVCRQPRSRGSRNDAGDVFVCAGCEADARQFIEIQDSIWVETGQDAESSNETNDEASP